MQAISLSVDCEEKNHAHPLKFEQLGKAAEKGADSGVR